MGEDDPDKRRSEAEELNQLTMDEGARACAEAVARLPRRDPPADEPDVPVDVPLKPKPNLRSGASALPEPEPEDALPVVKAPILPK